jgi:hypothetical protein
MFQKEFSKQMSSAIRVKIVIKCEQKGIRVEKVCNHTSKNDPIPIGTARIIEMKEGFWKGLHNKRLEERQSMALHQKKTGERIYNLNIILGSVIISLNQHKTKQPLTTCQCMFSVQPLSSMVPIFSKTHLLNVCTAIPVSGSDLLKQ